MIIYRQKLVSEGLHWPNGLALDYEENRLYWTDGGNKKIESCDLDGQNRKTILEAILHPYGIVVFGIL